MCRVRPSQLVHGVWQRLGQLSAETGIGLQQRVDDALPWDPGRPQGQGNEIGDRATIHRHAQPLAGLDTPEHVGRVVTELPDGDIS